MFALSTIYSVNTEWDPFNTVNMCARQCVEGAADRRTLNMKKKLKLKVFSVRKN
jgi:hypothetical protein